MAGERARDRLLLFLTLLAQRSALIIQTAAFASEPRKFPYIRVAGVQIAADVMGATLLPRTFVEAGQIASLR